MRTIGLLAKGAAVFLIASSAIAGEPAQSAEALAPVAPVAQPAPEVPGAFTVMIGNADLSHLLEKKIADLAARQAISPEAAEELRSLIRETALQPACPVAPEAIQFWSDMAATPGVPSVCPMLLELQALEAPLAFAEIGADELAKIQLELERAGQATVIAPEALAELEGISVELPAEILAEVEKELANLHGSAGPQLVAPEVLAELALVQGEALAPLAELGNLYELELEGKLSALHCLAPLASPGDSAELEELLARLKAVAATDASSAERISAAVSELLAELAASTEGSDQ